MKTSVAKRIRIVIGLTITALFCLLSLNPPVSLTLLEAKLYDFRFKIRGAIKPPDSVVIAAIDEKSLARLGRWPWSRDVMARLVERLSQADAAVVAFDVIFPEPEAHDALFARALEQAGNVILPMAFDFEQKMKPVPDPILERSALVSFVGEERFKQYPPIMSGGILTVPARQLKQNAQGLAHINMLPDEFDGTLRWEALLLGHDGFLYPSLALRAIAGLKGISTEQIVVDVSQGIRLGKIAIPTDHWGRMPINYYGSGKNFPVYSISDILDGTVGTAQLANRIVFVGATAIGIFDLRVTPISAVLPGVEKNASVAASILENRFIRKVPVTYDLLFLLVTGGLLTLLLSRLRPVWGGVITLAAIGIVLMTGFALFNRGIWINLAYPLNSILLIFMAVTAWSYTFEERYARQIRAMFSSYITHTIVNELINNPEMARLGGEKRVVTILFSDVKGFTTFSEMHSPEEVVSLLNEYLGAMTDVILKWGGTLDKFIGDAIVVFWNAPQPVEDHAERAVRCALEMGRRLDELQAAWITAGKPRLAAGIGINTGEAVVGNIGAEGKKMDYTIIGDQVNLTSRVESLTRKFDSDILITGATVEALQQAIAAGRLQGVTIHGYQRVIVKGKEQPVSLYGVDPLPRVEEPFVFTECPEGEVVKMTEK